MRGKSNVIKRNVEKVWGARCTLGVRYLPKNIVVTLQGWKGPNWGTTLTDQHFIQVEIKSRLKSGNARYHLLQNLVS
jgi:hypothetical protein